MSTTFLQWLRRTCLLVIYILPFIGTDNRVAGPYDIVFQHMEHCKDVGTGEMELYIKVKKLSRTKTVFDGNVTLKVPFDDNLLIEVNVGQFTNNGIKENFFKKEFGKACSTLSVFLPNTKKKLFKALGIPAPCPVAPGQYSLQNFSTTETISQIPVFFYNKYRTEVIYKYNGRRIGCDYYFINVVPKKAHKKPK